MENVLSASEGEERNSSDIHQNSLSFGDESLPSIFNH